MCPGVGCFVYYLLLYIFIFLLRLSHGTHDLPLWCAGFSLDAVCGFSCPAACGISAPQPGMKHAILHWKVDS